MPGKYRLNKRAVRQEETRERIVEAAVALHTTVGPAHTTDAAIAEGAGVTRVTFYRHFPDDVALFQACSLHGLKRWPPPDPPSWRPIREPEGRLRQALQELYSYYRVAGAGLSTIMRDRPLLPAGLSAFPSRFDVLRAMPEVLLEGWGARGRRRQVLEAAISHATSVRTWDSLVREQGLKEGEAIELLVAMVLAANMHDTPDSRRRASRG